MVTSFGVNSSANVGFAVESGNGGETFMRQIESGNSRHYRTASWSVSVHSGWPAIGRQAPSFNPTIPATINPMQPSRADVAGSANSRMPRVATPSAPIPVQTAYAVPTREVFYETL